jgi:7-methyl-GTP pyrophosphatase
MDLILASTSVYRAQLLKRLGLPFRCEPPLSDEKRLPDEAPEAMARRLSLLKATAVAQKYPGALVIGSDQVAALGSTVLGKPGGYDGAFEQLSASSGRQLLFYTGLAVVCLSRQFERNHVEPFRVNFRDLSTQEISNYLQREQPYDCAGSFKCEGLGVALFTHLSGDDPTSLQGLPLIPLTGMLNEAGVNIL